MKDAGHATTTAVTSAGGGAGGRSTETAAWCKYHRSWWKWFSPMFSQRARARRRVAETSGQFISEEFAPCKRYKVRHGSVCVSSALTKHGALWCDICVRIENGLPWFAHSPQSTTWLPIFRPSTLKTKQCTTQAKTTAVNHIYYYGSTEKTHTVLSSEDFGPNN